MATPETEIRKLRPVELYSLAKTLNPDFWKILMGNIKKPGSDIPMFTSEHIALIENAASKQRRSASEIFLDEWGTMGRVRPTIKSTIELLVEAELFRAADFLAVEVLKSAPPKRPNKGPAASIEIPNDILDNYNERNDSSNENFDYRNYLTAVMDDQNANVNTSSNNHMTSPNLLSSDIGVIEVEFSEMSMKNDRDIVINATQLNSGSDLIKFSSDNLKTKEINGNKVSSDSELNSADNMNNLADQQSASFLPNLSIFMLDSQKNVPEQKLMGSLNPYQELESSKLPSCNNDRDVFSSYQGSSSTTDYSMISSNSLDSSDNTSDNLQNNSMPEISNQIIESPRQEINKQVNDNIPKNVVDYDELPLTVVEFHKK